MNTPALTGTIEVATPTIEEELQQALVKHNVTDERIAQMLAKASEYDKPIESAAQYIETKAVLKEIAKVRIIGEKGIAEVASHYTQLWQEANRVKKDIGARINQPELIILQHTSKWERDQKALEEEREAAIAAMREERKGDLMNLGYQFVPGPPEHRYELEGKGIAVRDIMEFDHETWTNRFSDLRMHGEAIQERIKAEFAAKEAEEQRIAEVGRQQEAQRIKLEGMLRSARISELKGMGLEEHAGGYLSVMLQTGELKTQLLDITVGNLGVFTDEQWEAITLDVRSKLKERDAITEEHNREEKQKKLRNERYRELEAIDPNVVVPQGIELSTQEEWTAFVANFKAKADETREHNRISDLIRNRTEALKSAGWAEAYHPQTQEPQLGLSEGNGPFMLVVSINSLHLQNDEEFDGMIATGNSELQRRAYEAKAKAAAEAEEQARQRILAEQQAEAAAKAKQLAQRGDIQKWNDFVSACTSAAPTMDSAIGNQAVKRFIKGLNDFTPGLLRDLESK